MNISKKRLIRIIKEELEQEATPGYGSVTASDIEINEPPAGGGSDPTAVAANILSIIGSHAQPDQVILAFVELLHPVQRQDLAQILVQSLMGGEPMAMTPPSATQTPGHSPRPPSEYGEKTGMGFVKTREDIERMIGDELVSLLKEDNIK